MAWNRAETPPSALDCVSLPFTAPTLTAMRVRPAAGGGLEMLLNNPAGGRGIYIARWPVLRVYASPTVHDITLAERVEALGTAAGSLSPATIRAVAIAIAAEGQAGRRLARAAARALDAQNLGHRRLRAHLLRELARCLRLPGSDSALDDSWATQPREQADWLAGAPRLLADHLAWPAPWQSCELSGAIAEIARLAWPLGIGPGFVRARLPRVLRLMEVTARTLRGAAGLDRLIEARTAEAGAALLRGRTLLDDPLALLAAWHDDPKAVARILQQPDWLLDGWDRLCLLSRQGINIDAYAWALVHDGETCIMPSRDPGDGLHAEIQPFGLAGGANAFERLIRNEHIRLLELGLYDPEMDHPDA